MLSILNHSLRIPRDLHLVSSSKMYPGRNIKRSYFSIRHWLSLFIVFSSSLVTTSGIILQPLMMRSLFLTEMRFHIYKCNIKGRWLTDIFKNAWLLSKEWYSDLSVVWKTWLFIFCTKFVNHANSFGMHGSILAAFTRVS